MSFTEKSMESFEKERVHPRVAFRYPNFRLFISARFLSVCAHQIMVVALSQFIYEVTRSPLHLGYLGLSLFLPRIGFTLFAGHTADRFDRRKIILICRSLQFLITIGMVLFLLFEGSEDSSLWILYVLLFLLGVANAYDGPASQAIVPEIVSPDHFSNAVAWGSSIFQMAFIVGPALGGGLYAFFGRAIPVFYFIVVLRFLSALLVSRMKTRPHRLESSELSWKVLIAGLHYVFQRRIILGTISLDLFAVLLGGAVALMPIFANDILKVGPLGLGILRAAPSVGGAIMAVSLAHLPPMKNAGRTMLRCVALFGIATIFFGLSRNFIFSIICLIILGAADMVSVVIRGVLVQVLTPSEMRGRVSAVNLVFIGASNELGEFESGLTASWFGTVPAVIIGGLGTLMVVAIWARRFPEILKFKSLNQPYE